MTAIAMSRSSVFDKLAFRAGEWLALDELPAEEVQRFAPTAFSHFSDGARLKARLAMDLCQGVNIRRSIFPLPLVLDTANLLRLKRKPLVYQFNRGAATTHSAFLRGGKGAGLAVLTSLGMPVPAGATITTEVGRTYDQKAALPPALAGELARAIRRIEAATGLRLGSGRRPLLLSVRSGAQVSMPGMMDTILNVGLNEDTLPGLARRCDARFAWDSYRRFLSMFGSTVMGVDKAHFEQLVRRARQDEGVTSDCDLSIHSLRRLCGYYKKLVKVVTGHSVPSDPVEQISMSIMAVLDSWRSPRAHAYRVSENIPHSWSTAVNIQAMVFGNSGTRSGTGVVFSRDPSTGQNVLFGEYLSNAQGEDVVAGVRTPEPVSSLADVMPDVYEKLRNTVARLEMHFNDIVDVEFTVDNGNLYILQCRSAKRTVEAAVNFAVDQVEAGRLDKSQAVLAVPYKDRQALDLTPVFDQKDLLEAATSLDRVLFNGAPASPGAVVGVVALSCETAKKQAAQGKSVVLVREDTSPDDLPGMLASKAIVTAIGGRTSHAAVVARGKGIPAVVGCKFKVDRDGRPLSICDEPIEEGQLVSVDGASGTVVSGALPFVGAAVSEKMRTFIGWVKEHNARAKPAQINAEEFRTAQSVNDWLNDFYASDLMRELSTAASPQFAAECAEYSDKVQERLATIFSCYLAYAVLGELGYYEGIRERITFGEMECHYGLKRHIGRREGEAAVASLEQRSADEVALFFERAAQVFRCPSWSSAFGGKKWALIAETGRDYMNGKLPRAVFIDHVFDLRHNGGCMFNKHSMVSDRSNETYLVRQLDVKKKTEDLSTLFKRLSIHGKFNAGVMDLFARGIECGAWSDESGFLARPSATKITEHNGSLSFEPGALGPWPTSNNKENARVC